MKNIQKGFALLPVIIIVVLLLIGGGAYIIWNNQAKPQTNDELQNVPAAEAKEQSNQPATSVSCDKEENCCSKNEDCKYLWFTGRCNTPEYVAKVQKEDAAKGLSNGEAPPRDNVTCTCENTKCVTHG